MMIEDLHWVDSVSQEVLEAITRATPSCIWLSFTRAARNTNLLGAIERLSPRFSSTPLRTGDVRRLVAVATRG